RARRWRSHASNFAALVAATLLIVLVGFLWEIRDYVYLPIKRLGATIDRFRHGERDQRAEVVGVVELQEMAETFNDMADTLARQRQKQLGFLAAVAHDIRNPLSGLKAAASILQSGRPLPPETSLQRIFHLVGRQVDSLDRLTADLLDATRAEAGQ